MIYILPILAVFAGYLISLFLKPSSTSFKLLLSFSGAYLLSITVFELLPEVYRAAGDNIGVFIMIGLLLQIILEFISNGVEHGHMHHQEKTANFPLLLLLSLGIHSLLDGFPINQNEHILFGILIHKIPVAAILAIFLKHAKIGQFKSLLFLSIFAFMTPLGSYIENNFEVVHAYSVYLNAVVIGVFLHVSTIILFETSKNHTFNASKLLIIIAAILLAYFL